MWKWTEGKENCFYKCNGIQFLSVRYLPLKDVGFLLNSMLVQSINQQKREDVRISVTFSVPSAAWSVTSRRNSYFFHSCCTWFLTVSKRGHGRFWGVLSFLSVEFLFLAVDLLRYFHFNFEKCFQIEGGYYKSERFCALELGQTLTKEWILLHHISIFSFWTINLMNNCAFTLLSATFIEKTDN